MLKNKIILFFPLTLYSFNQSPWFDNFLEFQLVPSYVYETYKGIQTEATILQISSKNHLLKLNILMPILPKWEITPGFEYMQISAQHKMLSCAGLQIRYCWLNDLLEDPISMVVGFRCFQVSDRSLKNINCYYHQKYNLEIQSTLGKDYAKNSDYRGFRTYGAAAIGVANCGSPWLRFFLIGEGWINRSYLGLSLNGYRGFGHDDKIDPLNFYGYADIAHQNLDLGIHYTYEFCFSGKLILSYIQRIYARNFPYKAKSFEIEYRWPFSLF